MSMTPDEVIKQVSETRETLRDLKESGASKADLKALEERLGADLRASLRATHEASISRTLAQHSTGNGDGYQYRAGSADDAEKHAECFMGKGEDAIQMRTIEFEDGTSMPGLLDDTSADSEWQSKLQTLITQRSLVRLCRERERRPAGAVSPQTDREIVRHMNRAPAPIRKIWSDQSGLGAEWIDDLVLPDVQRTVEIERRVEGLFGVINVGPSGSFKMPFQNYGFRPFKQAAPTTDDPSQFSASSVATADRTFTPVKMVVRGVIDEDASEDSIIAAMPYLQQEIAKGLIDGVEDCIINGDTAATHQDTGLTGWDIRGRWGTSGLGGTDDHRRCWIGLRARATDVSNTTDQGSAQTAAGFATAMGKVGKHAFKDLVCIVSPEYLIKMIQFDEVETLDKFGVNAGILAGVALGSIYGVPIVVSEFVDAEYNASGVYDDSTKTKTGFILVNRERFKMFNKRGRRVRMQSDFTRGVVNLVADQRALFGTFDSSTEKNVHWSYNLTP